MRRNRDHRRTALSKARAATLGGCQRFSKGVENPGAGRREKKREERPRVIRRASALIYFTLKSPRYRWAKGRARYNDARNRKWHVWGDSSESPFFPPPSTPIACDTCVLATSGATPSAFTHAHSLLTLFYFVRPHI